MKTPGVSGCGTPTRSRNHPSHPIRLKSQLVSPLSSRRTRFRRVFRTSKGWTTSSSVLVTTQRLRKDPQFARVLTLTTRVQDLKHVAVGSGPGSRLGIVVLPWSSPFSQIIFGSVRIASVTAIITARRTSRSQH